MNLEAYQAFLAELQGERQQLERETETLDQTIRYLERKIAQLQSPRGRNGLAPSPGVYAGMKLADAAKAYLIAAKGTAQSNSAIAEAVRAGGHSTRSDNLQSNINTALGRRDDPELVKVKGGWRYRPSPSEQQQ